MEDLRQLALRSSWSGDSKTSAVESVGLCPSCRGSGLRPITGLWVALDDRSISLGLLLTSPRAWSTSTKRWLAASVASVFAVVGWSTWISALLHAL